MAKLDRDVFVGSAGDWGTVRAVRRREVSENPKNPDRTWRLAIRRHRLLFGLPRPATVGQVRFGRRPFFYSR